MAIARYENVDIEQVTNGKNSFGEQTTTNTKLFSTRARVEDVANSLTISEKYRMYSDLVKLTFNFTPAIRAIVDNQQSYAIKWRGNDWRITDVRESNDRMNVTMICYRNDPGVLT